MAIKSLKFDNKDTGWSLEQTTFGDMNLLVGQSGAGKTQILEALRSVRHAGLYGTRHIGRRYVSSSAWGLELQIDGECYIWSAEIQVARVRMWSSTEDSSDGLFLREKIATRSRTIIDRSNGEFFFEGERLPRLQESESAIKLLEAERSIKPIYEALRNWAFAETAFSIPNLRLAKESVENYSTLSQLQRATELDPLTKGYVLQARFPELFDELRITYGEIFPQVEDIKITSYSDFGAKPEVDIERDDLAVGIRERGVAGWVTQRDLSAGMTKVFVYLVDLILASRGSVFLVDELENSLGIDCLPEVAEQFLEKAGEIQFVITSHHPQVINAISTRDWKLVTRRGSVVTVLEAESIPALQTASPLQKFTQLINLPEYAEGVV